MFGTQTWAESYTDRLTNHMTRVASLYDQFILPSNTNRLSEFLYEQMTERINLIHKMNPKLNDLVTVAEQLYPEKGMRRKFVSTIIFGA